MRPSRARRVLVLALALACLAGAASRLSTQPVATVQALPLPQGWNLIADPGGIISSGPAYTYQKGDAGYETITAGTPLLAGLGYWVLAQGRSAVPLSAGGVTATILAPAGQFVMVGDPSGVLPGLVTGADFLITYDPVNGYQQVGDGVLSPGQGAFAYSAIGGSVTIAALGTSTANCLQIELGAACAVAGACPAGYPVAVTQDGLAHPAPGPADPPVTGTIVLCFNASSQALAAGYTLAPATRIIIYGPSSAQSSSVNFTVISAELESPDAFMARLLANGDQLCTGCDVSGATAIVTVQYGVENINRPLTLISTGTMVSAHSPQETSPSYLLMASQAAVDPIHNGSPTSGSVSAVFTRAKFLDIDAVDWRLDHPLIDTSDSIPQPHGPSVEFVLNFRGWQAGVIMPHGFGTTPLPQYVPNSQWLTPIPYATTTPAPAQQIVVLPAGQSAPAPSQSIPTGAPAVATPPTGTSPVNPSAPYTR